MASIAERCQRLVKWAKGQAPDLPTAATIPAANVTGGSAPPELEADARYFEVRLNQLYLGQERQWFTTWDPLALVVTEFLYDGDRITVPSLVGRTTLEKKLGQTLPASMLLHDNLAAGLYPYKGGQVDITVVLYRVKRDDFAHVVLDMAESAAALFPLGASLDLYLDVAAVVLDGIEKVLDISETEAVLGRRHGLNGSRPDTTGSGYFAIVDGDVAPDTLHVDGDRLHQRDSSTGRLVPYDASDLLLYSLASVPARDDIDSFSFGRLLKHALALAASPADDAKKQAKAAMLTAFAETIESPDLVWPDGENLRDEYLTRLTQELERADKVRHLGVTAPGDLRRAAALHKATQVMDL